MKDEVIDILETQLNIMYLDTFTKRQIAERLVQILDKNNIDFKSKE